MILLFYGLILIFASQLLIGLITSIMLSLYLHAYDLGYSIWRQGPSYKGFLKAMKEHQNNTETYRKFKIVKPWMTINHYFRFATPIFLILLIILVIQILDKV